MSSPRPHHLMPRGFGGGILLLLVTTTVIEAQSMEEMGMKFISTDIICNDMLQQKCFWKKWYWMPNIIYYLYTSQEQTCKLPQSLVEHRAHCHTNWQHFWWGQWRGVSKVKVRLPTSASRNQMPSLSGMVYQNTMLYSHRARVILYK